MCLQFTPKRKSVDEEKYDWKTPRPPLINKNVTEQKVRTWRQKWNNPPPPRQKRTDKRTLPFVTITCNGELFDFDRKTGEKIGCLDLDQVEAFLEKLKELFTDEVNLGFKLSNSMDYLTEGYYRRKDQYDITRNVKRGKSIKNNRYT